MSDWSTVTVFENKIAEFFGAPHAVAVDSATHGIELCLRLTKADIIYCPRRTYLSIPFLAEKLNIFLKFIDVEWKDYYKVYDNIYDAAVLWKRDSYVPGTFMSISFQFQKHLSLNRGGIVLCDNAEAANELRKMAYDGREFGVPWREQDIKTFGLHYYMPIETAELGLKKLQAAIQTPPKIWTHLDYPDLTQMKIFKQ